MSRPRTIAIGDIHGCAAALRALLEAIQPTEWDKIVTLGDYVDRGPDSRGVIEQLIELAQRCVHVPLIGNHEVMMLEALDKGGDHLNWWWECGGRETIASYGKFPRDVPKSHVKFLRGLEDFHETQRHIFVHANYDYDVPMSDQSRATTLWEHLNFRQPPPHYSGKTVFVGHTPQLTGEILDSDHLVGIDTACAVGGYLTAIDVDSRQIWQADADGNLRQQ